MSEEKKVDMGKFQRVAAFLFGPGMRKVSVLGSAMALAECAGVVALFTGHMTEAVFVEHTIGVLQWGGGIFAVGNVLEHVSSAVKARIEKPQP